MSAHIEYRELDPSPMLAPFVRCLWHLRGPTSSSREAQPIVPDGCVEIVINRADPFVRVNGGTHLQPTEMLVGQHSGPVVVIPTGAIDVWGVRLHPWSAAASLKIPVSELNELTVPLDDVVRPSFADELYDHPGDVSAETLLIAALERWFGRRKPPEREARAAVELITRRVSLPSVRALSAELGRSTRWVQRTFRETVGLSPKTLSRISRVQRTMRAARSHPGRTWASIAADAGYFDQSHLVRDFREIVGCTPTAFSARDRTITDAFIES